MKKTEKISKGFTIIEVVLVLAIAGLIFMMVFIALPSLQRSQRDTQRSNDISRLQSQINAYQSNNRGRIPTTGTYVIGHTADDKKGATDTKSWAYFYDNYLIVSSAGSKDTFEDPDGEPYSLWIQPCSNTATGKPATGDDCDQNTQRSSVSFDDQSNGAIQGESNAKNGDTVNQGTGYHSIGIVTHATCEGEVVKYSSGSRKVAITYKKEGGGAICLNN